MFSATHVVAKNVANLYEQPNASSPLDTQAVLGESVQLTEQLDGFVHVVTGSDLYSGWIASKWLVCANALPRLQCGTVKRLFAEVFSSADRSSELYTKLVMGTKVRLADSQESSIYVKLVLPDGRQGYVQRSAVQTKPPNIVPIGSPKMISAISSRATTVAKQLIGTPYLWGGTTPFGIDCSGLVQLCYAMAGIQLRRNSYMQMADRRFCPIETGKGLNEGTFKAGDLLGFGPSGKINHIGLALGDGRFIHSSGSDRRGAVAVDSCQNEAYAGFFINAVRLNSDAAIDQA